ncbi:39S ribosomal protein L54, mitochondrial [Bufo bufo]|uniref:39S ribosomal protein L54, mitochondrial n=1 Tax=Bufo bufo TaxID=8384 RepID=UPI001ABEE484|nr:39S ribosomal protein L54, mitochondrial [Bufo bufo]
MPGFCAQAEGDQQGPHYRPDVSFKRLWATLISRPGAVQLRSYAKKPVAKGKGKGFVKEVQKGPEVCKDPALLTTHAMGVNIYKSGSDVKLMDDSQYPEWLFQLDLEPPKPLEERSPDTPQYWKLLRKLHMWRNNRLAKAKKF